MTAQEQQWKDGKRGQRVCRGCPVATECLRYAIEGNEKLGVWGGSLLMARKALRKDWLTHDMDLDDLLKRYIDRMRDGDYAW